MPILQFLWTDEEATLTPIGERTTRERVVGYGEQ